MRNDENMKTVIVVADIRPEVIKMVPNVRELQKDKTTIKLFHCGQH